MKNRALESAYEFLNDKNLKIVSYAENDNIFLFQYEFENKPIFDNSMVQVDKRTCKASNYIITEHFKELNTMKFKDVE